jgi:hypothetical protein
MKRRGASVYRGYLVSDDGKRYELTIETAGDVPTLASKHAEDVGRPEVISCKSEAPEGVYTLDCPGFDLDGQKVRWKNGWVNAVV